MPRRSYDQFCPLARALDHLGERWTLLVVRELLGGPRRYSDLLADLPGVSTDVLAARLREMERDGLVARRRMPRSTAHVYELAPAGRELAPVLAALAAWGGPRLGERRSTDSVREHWFAVPLAALLRPVLGSATVELRLGEVVLTLRVAEDPGYVDGPTEAPDVVVETDLDTVTALVSGALDMDAAITGSRLRCKRTGAGAASPEPAFG
ncbi:transcriptional regulator, HxlR family [Streptoalloteichus tenebrarius]|uniref:Transcriptional regulator, HxlR family n=1 Tax=Streptoalloteichus tenebrarius (strain ATCC 17920 / DSM 40477 / JCM 4838 / CBS 697.72 / NBRC 16177 / NCIMB 11028 / NRRL B-12390 / A12253. 1 / ISP 5477) TaxID=1933 RepID=A0ABT1I2M7_STRSD|nr:helix-turn-helix domain-containing protein [Streptoalloteichus tenebrarius]MCP2262036.1 transcriptional regulator, HxlR family [Streptoalloteichus tenebrarius]BFF01324.1 helix-turn-helix domain-containing protein [Streptoalloteichus tenebrarius]